MTFEEAFKELNRLNESDHEREKMLQKAIAKAWASTGRWGREFIRVTPAYNEKPGVLEFLIDAPYSLDYYEVACDPTAITGEELTRKIENGEFIKRGGRTWNYD